ncbi:MAG: aminoglycoside phosphotransferase family protein [Candidatus Nanohaloarchaea archaeon]
MRQVAEKDITKAINQLESESQIIEIEDISGHNNRIFKVRLKDRTVICKFCTGENSKQDCRKEVNMHQLLKTKTNVKTPEILYSDPSANKTEFPFFITEYIEGESLQDSFPELKAREQIEVVEQAVHILGEVHSKISFEYAGELIPENKDIIVDGKFTWIEYLKEELNQAIEKAGDTRFSDVTEKSEDFVNKLSELDEPEKTLVFYDFRPDNVIAMDGRIEALIDFERAWSGDPLWDYAYSEMSFVEPHRYYDMHEPPNADEEELRKAFQEGYETQRELEENWRQKVELYKLCIIIKRFNSFEDWTESTEMTEEEIKRQENLLRTHHNRLYKDV